MGVGRFTPEHIKNSFLKNFLIYLGIPVGVVLCILMLRCSADQWYLTLCDPVYYSPSGSSVCGILQARILEWVGISSSRVSSWLRNQTQSPALAGRFFTTELPKKPQSFCGIILFVHLILVWNLFTIGKLISESRRLIVTVT